MDNYSIINGPMTEKRDLRTYANSEDPDQTAHPRTGLDLRSSPTQYRNVVDVIGLLAIKF